MTLRKTIEIVDRLASNGAMKQYAITGAVAALYYIQPTLTEDLDILVSVGDFEKHDSVLLEGWLVRFLPAASAFDEEALEQADEVEVQPKGEAVIKTRIFKAEHLVANAVKLGRLKDLARVEEFLERKAVDLTELATVLTRHDLMPACKECRKAGKADPLSQIGRSPIDT
jgi:hypothetical protein